LKHRVGTQVNGTGPTSVYSAETAFTAGQAIEWDYFLRGLTAIFAAQVQPFERRCHSFTAGIENMAGGTAE
jgi:hypothetical protein